MSKMIFMKYLPATTCILNPRSKLLRISCLIFQVFGSPLRYLMKVSLNIYQKVIPELVPEFEFQYQL